MRMYVKKGKRLVGLFLPTGWVVNRFTAAFASKELKKHGISITKEQAQTFFDSINHYRRTHKDWVLAEADSADGERIFVKL